MRRWFVTATLVVLAFVWAAPPAHAATIMAVDAGYYRFGLDFVGAPVGPRGSSPGLLESNGSPFTFTAASDVVLTIVDLQLSVDRLWVTISEAVLGQVFDGPTSVQTPGGDVGTDVAAALADARYSRGIYNLGPGDYTVAVLVFEGQLLPGSGAIGVSSVPEPATLALMGLALLGLGASRRRR